jgi:hypothetical protein
MDEARAARGRRGILLKKGRRIKEKGQSVELGRITGVEQI